MNFDWKGIENCSDKHNTYILIDVLVCSIVEHIYELCSFVFCQVFLLISHREADKEAQRTLQVKQSFFSVQNK